MYRDMFDVVEIENKDKQYLHMHTAVDNGEASKDFDAALTLHAVSEMRVKISFYIPHQPIRIKVKDFRTI